MPTPSWEDSGSRTTALNLLVDSKNKHSYVLCKVSNFCDTSLGSCIRIRSRASRTSRIWRSCTPLIWRLTSWSRWMASKVCQICLHLMSVTTWSLTSITAQPSSSVLSLCPLMSVTTRWPVATTSRRSSKNFQISSYSTYVAMQAAAKLWIIERWWS